MSKINQFSVFIQKPTVRKSIAALTDPKCLASALALEATVFVGRSTQSYRRGGPIEFKERVFEELSTAAVWLFGVKSLCWAFDKIAKHVFKLDTSIDMVPEKMTKVKGFLATNHFDPLEKMTKGLSDKFKRKLVMFKFGKIILSSAISIALVGSVIPRINQARTRRMLANKQKQDELKKNLPNTAKTNPSKIDNSPKTIFEAQKNDQSQKNTNNNSNKINNNAITTTTNSNNDNDTNNFSDITQFLNNTKRSKPSFTGIRFIPAAIGAFSILNAANLLNGIKSVCNYIENDDIGKLLSVDGGVTGGRALHARNKDEKIEILVRDLGSIPFYLWTTPLISGLFAYGSSILGKIINSKFVKRHKNLQNLLNPLAESFMVKGFNDKLGVNTSLGANVVDFANEKIKNKAKNAKNAKNTEDLKNILLGNENKNLKEILLKKAGSDGRIKREGLTLAEEELHNFNKFARLNTRAIASEDLIKFANKIKETNSKDSEKLMDFAEGLYKKTYGGHLVKRSALRSQISALGLADSTKKDVISNIIDKMVRKDERFIIKEQIEHVVKGGLLNDPEFLGQAYAAASDKTNKISNFLNPRKFTSADTLKSVRDDLNDYTTKFITKLSKAKSLNSANIEKSLEWMKNTNMGYKTAWFAAGFSVSAFFLSFAIPRFQCWITKKRTGKNEFPGIENLTSANKKK